MITYTNERPVERALCRREHSVSVAKAALPLWCCDDKKRETYDDQVRLELEYLQK